MLLIFCILKLIPIISHLNVEIQMLSLMTKKKFGGREWLLEYVYIHPHKATYVNYVIPSFSVHLCYKKFVTKELFFCMGSGRFLNTKSSTWQFLIFVVTMFSMFLELILAIISFDNRPLIRIIGDRFPWQVKSAILSTLTIMIRKGGMALKPFLPQLQTTFVKCLQDTTR